MVSKHPQFIDTYPKLSQPYIKPKALIEILETLKNAKLLVVEGTIYPLLTRLKNDGLLTYRWEESTSGPPRKYYGLTEDGQTFLDELNGTWTELSNAVNLITNQNTES